PRHASQRRGPERHPRRRSGAYFQRPRRLYAAGARERQAASRRGGRAVGVVEKIFARWRQRQQRHFAAHYRPRRRRDLLRLPGRSTESRLTDARVLVEEESLFDLLPVGIAFVERGSIARCNRTLEQMLGYAPGELAGKPFAALADRDALEGEVEFRRKDGSRPWCRLASRAAQACVLVAFARAAG